jgi:hypothetical protein
MFDSLRAGGATDMKIPDCCLVKRDRSSPQLRGVDAMMIQHTGIVDGKKVK